VIDPPTPFPGEIQGLFHPLSSCGPIRNVAAWLARVDSAGLKQELATPQGNLAVLKSTPAALDTLGMTLAGSIWRERPAPKEWSLTEIFCHLRDVDRDVNLPRLQRILSEENPFLVGINSDQWALERDYQNQDGPAALREFITTRARLVAELEKLDELVWQRSARHAIFGPTNLFELVSFIATHDRTHVQQSQANYQALAG
jgi:hypothetical protein